MKDLETYVYNMNSPVGELSLVANEKYLTGLCFVKNKSDVPDGKRKKTDVIAKTEKQLEKYFKGELEEFDLPISIQGTPFQLSVWNELRKIKMGTLRSYSSHAERLKKPKAVRAVGSAIGKNPIGIIIPCHRVIAKSGGMGGFSGGLDVKHWLLEHEQKIALMSKKKK